VSGAVGLDPKIGYLNHDMSIFFLAYFLRLQAIGYVNLKFNSNHH
jgi:hypothetical protein